MMKITKPIFTLLLVLLPFALHAQPPATSADSVVMQSALYFDYNVNKWVPRSQYAALDQFLESAIKLPDSKIVLVGWADSNGKAKYNRAFSLERANCIKRHLVLHGVAPERIEARGAGIDKYAESAKSARRVDLLQIAHIVEPPAPEPEPEPEQPKQVEVVMPEPMPAPEPEPMPEAAPEPYVEPTPEKSLSSWYAGVKLGMPFGVSTFSAFGTDKTRVGYNFGVMGGYRIDYILSVEFSAMWGNVGLGSVECCADYWLGADGVQYVAPVAGAAGSYYGDLYSSVFLQQYGLHLNVDLIQVFKANDATRWSVFVSPAIYGVGTSATIKKTADGSQLFKAKAQFQFGVGADVVVGYGITQNLGIRLSSGINCVIGEPYDGIPIGAHGQNFVWNNNLSLTWRFNNKR